MLLRIKYLLDVRDMAAAVAFYTKTFGLDIAEQSDGWSELQFGSATVALHGGRHTDAVVRTGLSFTVDDLDATLEAVAANGGTVLNGPFADVPGLLLAELLDPDGNAFMAAQDTPA